jgi:hypothetical protein
MSEGSFSCGSFSEEIAEHLELKTRNSHLEPTMPLERYRDEPASETLADDRPTGDVSPNESLSRDPDSWWNARDRSPEFDWND